MKSNTFHAMDGTGLRIAIVGSRFNEELCDALVRDAEEALRYAGIAADAVRIVRVPGSFELPVAASALAQSGAYDAIVCLGVLIKGETKHDEYIATAVAQGLVDVGVATGVPVTFGVLTVNTREQAEARSLGREKKGWEAAMSAIETVRALR
jgi:6,7-dimethyl-8-ribityllumazine synthase